MTLNEAYALWKESSTPDNYEVFGAELYKYCKSLVFDGHSAQFDTYGDTIGDVVLKVLTVLDTYTVKPEATFATWVRLIINNAAIDNRRLRNNKREVALNPEITESPYDDIETRLTVKQIVKDLSQSDQDLIRADLEGYTYREVAEALNTTEPAIWQRWYRLKQKIARFDRLYIVDNKRVYHAVEDDIGHLFGDFGDGRKLIFPRGTWSIIHEAKKVC